MAMYMYYVCMCVNQFKLCISRVQFQYVMENVVLSYIYIHLSSCYNNVCIPNYNNSNNIHTVREPRSSTNGPAQPG